MDEACLRDFFIDKISVEKLTLNLSGSVSHINAKVSTIHISDMADTLTVTHDMLVKLCDAVIAGLLAAKDLKIIGFALMASDHFEWEDDDLLAGIISDWSCPEINYPSNLENIERCKRWLLGAEKYPQKVMK